MNRLTAFARTVREEVRGLDASPRALRRFGLVVGGVLAGVGLVVLWRRGWSPGVLSLGLGGVGGLLGMLGLAAPRALRPVFVAWMTLALAMGFVMTRVLLSLFFFLVLTPAGLLRRTFGRSPVLTRPDPEARSYWIPRSREEAPPRERLERMY